MTRRTASLLGAAALAFVSTLAAGAPAHAATYTSTGLRCTIVGNAGANRLVGTSHNDVICGLGGNDTIYGGGGNDVIDAGSGNDVVHAGTGNDRVYGGTGIDHIWGDAGADAINAGAGADVVSAGDGNDTVSAYDGDDRVSGGNGNDRLSGGNQDDTLSGGPGADVLIGGDGDDSLDGGSGVDVVVGGPGHNTCDDSAVDRQSECPRDVLPPTVGNLVLSPSTVDVSNGGATVVAELHAGDDTGVREARLLVYLPGGDARIDADATLVAGSARDGTWRATFLVPVGTPAGQFTIDTNVTDRINRTGSNTFSAALTVVNTHPDTESPVLQSLSLDTTEVDARTAQREIHVSAHLTDDYAGASSIHVCPFHSFADGTWAQGDICFWMNKTGGTRQDATWTGTVWVEAGAADGVWDLMVSVGDAAGHSDVEWYGPKITEYRQSTPWPAEHVIPGGAGSYLVHGVPDTHPPELVTMTVPAAPVDATTSSHQASIDIHTRDVEGIDRVDLVIDCQASVADDHVLYATSAGLVSGNEQDGTWRFLVDVPQGTPACDYRVQVLVRDRMHSAGWSGEVRPGDAAVLFTAEQAPNGAVFRVG